MLNETILYSRPLVCNHYFAMQTPVRQTVARRGAKGAIMFFKGKREAKILRVLAAALGVFLVAESGALSVPLSPLLMHSEIP